MGRLGQGLEGWGGVMSVCVVSLDSLCRWQVHVSVYCARRIPAHLRCTHCSRFQRSRPTRGGTVRQQTTPANRDHYYPDSLLSVSAGFMPRVSSQRLN